MSEKWEYKIVYVDAERWTSTGLPGDLTQRVAHLAWLAQHRHQPPPYLLLLDRRLDLRPGRPDSRAPTRLFPARLPHGH